MDFLDEYDLYTIVTVDIPAGAYESAVHKLCKRLFDEACKAAKLPPVVVNCFRDKAVTKCYDEVNKLVLQAAKELGWREENHQKQEVADMRAM